MTLNPVMGEYLSMKGNQRPDPTRNIRPDENFARELLQLFTIGLEQLNPDGTPKLGADGVPLPTYDQETVEAFAHVFTGLALQGRGRLPVGQARGLPLAHGPLPRVPRRRGEDPCWAA